MEFEFVIEKYFRCEKLKNNFVLYVNRFDTNGHASGDENRKREKHCNKNALLSLLHSASLFNNEGIASRLNIFSRLNILPEI